MSIAIQFTEGLNLIWLGALLTVLTMMLFFIRVFIITDLARTKDNLPLISTVTLIGLIISILTFIMQSPVSLLHINTQGLFAAIIGGVTYALYLLWYSKFNRLNSINLMENGKLASFELVNTEGKPITSASFIGSKSLLIFYRGNWCPLCMAQIKEVAKSYEKLGSMKI